MKELLQILKDPWNVVAFGITVVGGALAVGLPFWAFTHGYKALLVLILEVWGLLAVLARPIWREFSETFGDYIYQKDDRV